MDKQERKRAYKREYMRKRRAGEKVVAPVDEQYEELNWKPIEAWPGYEVSDTGLVKSVARVRTRSNGRPHTTPERVLRLSADTKGYYQFHPYRDTKRFHVLVHRAVFETFHRPLEPGEQVDHIDGDNKNNVVSNLRAVSGFSEHAKLTWTRVYKQKYDEGYEQALKDLKALRGE